MNFSGGIFCSLDIHLKRCCDFKLKLTLCALITAIQQDMKPHILSDTSSYALLHSTQVARLDSFLSAARISPTGSAVHQLSLKQSASLVAYYNAKTTSIIVLIQIPQTTLAEKPPPSSPFPDSVDTPSQSVLVHKGHLRSHRAKLLEAARYARLGGYGEAAGSLYQRSTVLVLSDWN